MISSQRSKMLFLVAVGLMSVATVEAMNMELKPITHLNMGLWNETISNYRQMDVWAKCMTSQGPCDMISSSMKAMMSGYGLTLSVCPGCNKDQRIKMAMFFKELKTNYPLQYRRMLNQYRFKNLQTSARTRVRVDRIRPRVLQSISFKQLDELLTNQKKVKVWAMCVMSQGPCDVIGSAIKDVLSSWEVTGEVCDECSKVEKRKLYIILQTLKTVYPNYYNLIIDHFNGARKF